jgi:uncharacterized protein YbjT (DUF2867 family)
MTTAVVGATGHIGSEIVRGLLARNEQAVALVRDRDDARRAFGEATRLNVRPTQLDDPRDVADALRGVSAVFIAMGSVGIQGVLQRVVINTAAGTSSIKQVTRVAVLNTSADSLGINQRAHYSIDQFAAASGVPYSTIRPAIFSLALLNGAREIRASRTWTGIADRGRTALIDHRDAAEAGLHVLTDRTLWGTHHDVTGPDLFSWPEALDVLSAELGERVSFRVATERDLLQRLIGAGIAPGEVELLIAREWSILAGENNHTTDTFEKITGRPPRPLADFLHEHRTEFL